MKFLAIFLLLFSLTAYADPDDDCVGNPHHCNGGGDGSTVNVNASSTMDSNVSTSVSNRSMGFGLGDVDIAQCYRSYQFLVWQDTKINPVCLADSYDAKGLHHMAAIIRCDVKHIRKHFDSDEACVKANTIQIEAPNPLPAVMYELEEHEEAEEEHTVQIQQQRVYIDDLESRLKKMEDASRASSRAAAQKRQAEKEYAQQLLNELEEYRNE